MLPPMDHHAKISRFEIDVGGLFGEGLPAAFPELHAQTLEWVPRGMGGA